MVDRRGLSAAVERIVTRLFGPRLDVLALYPGTIVSQDGDGTCSITFAPGCPAPNPTKVPIRWPVPGMSAKVKSGTLCKVAFEGANPSSPVVVHFEGSGLTDLTIEATGTVNVKAAKVRLADGDLPFARAGDAVVCNITPAIAAKIVALPPPTAIPIPGVILVGSKKVTGA